MTKHYLEECEGIARLMQSEGKTSKEIEEYIYRYLLEEYDINHRLAGDLARESTLCANVT